MKATDEMEPATLVRMVLLKYLGGEELSSIERNYLAIAYTSRPLRKMCEDLKRLYRSPAMLALLKERPNSPQLEEALECALAIRGQKIEVVLIKKAQSFLIKYLKKWGQAASS